MVVFYPLIMESQPLPDYVLADPGSFPFTIELYLTFFGELPARREPYELSFSELCKLLSGEFPGRRGVVGPYLRPPGIRKTSPLR